MLSLLLQWYVTFLPGWYNVRKISRFIIDTVLRELPFLKEDKVITEETAERITGYYNEILAAQQAAVKPKKPKNQVKPAVVVFVVLGVVSGLLIATGIISLIAFNWNIIPRGAKTGSAFFILLVPQVLALLFLTRKNEKTLAPLKEGLSILWALLFGSMFAFVGQIYKTASYFELYLFLWAISTLGIMYLFHSISCFTLYAIQMMWLVIYMQSVNSFGILFFPMILLLIPFYVLESRRAGRGRIIAFRYILIFLSYVGLGIALEKSVPGLWIIAYPALFVLYYFIGLLIEKDDDMILLSPFRLGGIGGLVTFAFILTLNWPWKDIGWFNFRSGIALHDLIGMFDYFVCGALLTGVTVLAIVLLLKNRIKSIVNIGIMSAGFIVPLVYTLVAFEALGPDQATFMLSLFVTGIIVAVLFYSYRKRPRLSHAILFPLLFIPVFTKVIVYSPGTWSLALLFFVSFFYMLGMVFRQKMESALFTVYKIGGAVMIILICIVMLFQWTWFDLETEIFDGGIDFEAIESVWNLVFLAVFFTMLTGMAVMYLTSKKKTRDTDLIFTGFILGLPILYFLCSVEAVTAQVSAWILTAGIAFSILYILYKGIIAKRVELTAWIVTSVLVIPVLVKITIHAPIMFPLTMAVLFTYWMVSGQYFRTTTGHVLFQVYKMVGFIASSIAIYSLSFHTVAEALVEETMNEGLVAYVMAALLLLASLVPAALFAREKTRFNYAILLFPLFLAALFLGKAMDIEFFGSFTVMWVLTIIIVLVCLVEFYLGVVKKSLMVINFAAIFLIVTVLSRFLSLDVNLLAKAFVLLISGIIILVLNIILMLKYRKSSKGAIDEK
jgi:uncharacterized membrane protein